ncbi:hypothetical protein GW932_00815 [archaeon]|nr:hypothetical protein [archaeon]
MSMKKYFVFIFVFLLIFSFVSASNDFNKIKRNLDKDKQKVLNENLNKFDFEIVYEKNYKDRILSSRKLERRDIL